jgi:hypothetical protein
VRLVTILPAQVLLNYLVSGFQSRFPSALERAMEAMYASTDQ